jgi:hypothetical protein
LTSRAVSHERCPACAKLGRDRHADNLAVYDDGHKFCYACGYRHYGHISNSSMAKRLYQHSVLPHSDALTGLGELTFDLPPKAQTWLDKYGITQLEQLQNGIQWSETKQYLILPITNEHGYVVGTNSRYFGDNPKHPKYINSHSNASIFKLVSPSRDAFRSLVLVEDILSSIKVGRVCQSLCLTGTNIPSELFLRIISHCSRYQFSVIIWLDSNMHQKAIGYAKRFSQYLPSYAVIDTDRDPKEHTDLEIIDVLSRTLKILSPEQSTLA